MTLALGVLSVVTALIPFLLEYWRAKHRKQDQLAQVEADELRVGMDRVDKLYPPAP